MGSEKRLWLALLLLSSTAGQSEALECTILGRCIGNTVSLSDGGDKAECVELCQASPECQFYTYDYADTFCGSYADCPAVDATCESCVSGEDECDPVLCSEPGGCQGLLIDEFESKSDSECGDGCRDSQLCRFYTYFTESGNCLLFNTCHIDEEVCQGCFTSERDCQTPGDSSILLVVKTWTQEEVSVIDLANANKECEPLPAGNLTSVSHRAHGTFAGGDLTVCGEERADCFVYDPDSREWREGPRREDYRYFPFGLDLAPGRHWVSGGSEGPAAQATEVFDGEDFARSGAELPLATARHCAVKTTPVDDAGSQVVLVATGEGMGASAYLLDVSTGSATPVDDVPLSQPGSDLVSAACGLATDSDGRRTVVVAGGEYSEAAAEGGSYVYDLAGRFWRPGPGLPRVRTNAKAVQYGSSFVLVGGEDHDGDLGPFYEDILRYDPDRDEWEELPQTLDNPDGVWVALIAPYEFPVEC